MQIQILSRLGFASAFTAAFMLCCASTSRAQSDVTQPGDPIIASSANNPGSEGVANAIDNQPTKYLNFDTVGGPDNQPSGFVVSPAVGVTRVIGIALQSANDVPGRDPMHIVLEGSNDEAPGWDSGNWEMIYENMSIPAWTDVFGPDEADNRFQTQTFLFDNFNAYRHYRWTVVQTQEDTGCCMQIAEVELLGNVLPSDVTQPGDALIASSANNPGSEGVANAIDNQPTKYLNFDTVGGPDNVASGLVVTPAIGRTLVTGLTLQSANDVPGRDPMHVVLEGSNDEAPGWDSGNWEMIYENMSIPAWTDVFGPDEADNRFQTQIFLFDNFTPYRHYRWTVVETQEDTGCCMQIAEVELLGTGEPQDVTQPGDPIFASSANNPGSEGVANAIDGQPTKYLNFDTVGGVDNLPSGFSVAPQVGETTVIGLAMQSANDVPGRDPRIVRLEGTTAEVGGWDPPDVTWETIVELTVPAWTDVFGPDEADNRFQFQEFFFDNKTPYRSYRWTVLETQEETGCCMQIAEVELLAVTESVDCEKARFITQPVDTPVLAGASATFFVEVNGPWPLQWFRNGEAIPGANQKSFTTQPITMDNADDVYSVEIVGCEMSNEVMANIFTPSDTTSIGLNWVGSGANGAPTALAETDIAGLWQQAYWNNFEEPDSAGPMTIVDSDNNQSSITVEFDTSGEWGAGTGTQSADRRMLNGLVEANTTAGANFVVFHNVPAGNHRVLAYSVARPLEFPNINYELVSASTQTIFMRQMNADEYNPAPGFYRVVATSADQRGLGNYVQFDNVSPDGNGDIRINFTGAGGGNATLNGMQLVLDAPETVDPPAITKNPEPVRMIEGGTVVLTVEATGDDLTYQWRRNGRNLPDGGNVSGSTTATLTISNFSSENEGNYNVAVFNPGGSTISRTVSASLSTFTVEEDMVVYLKFDESSGSTAANSAEGGVDGEVNGTATWSPGQIDNALEFDGTSTYVFVPDYQKASDAVSASLWVFIDSDIDPFSVPMFIRNAAGLGMSAANPAEQFELGLIFDEPTGEMRLSAAISAGPNVARVTDSAAFDVLGEWANIVFVADGAQLKLYRNGELLGTTDYLGTINSPSFDWLSLGVRFGDQPVTDPPSPDPNLPDFMDGRFDDLAVWARALSDEEISKIYEAGLNGEALDTIELEPPDVITPTEPGPLGVSFSAGEITITWENGVLQSAPQVTGPWADEEGAQSPHTESTGDQEKYYRARSADQ